MYQRTYSPKYLEYAKGGAKWLQSEAEEVSPNIYRWPHIRGYRHETGLLCGTAGVGNSFILYYSVNPDESYLNYARGAARWLIKVAERINSDEVKWINYVDEEDYGTKSYMTGWYSGASGIGLFFLRLSQIKQKNW